MEKRLMDVVALLIADREPAVLRKPAQCALHTHRCRPKPASLRMCLLVLLRDWDRGEGQSEKGRPRGLASAPEPLSCSRLLLARPYPLVGLTSECFTPVRQLRRRFRSQR